MATGTEKTLLYDGKVLLAFDAGKHRYTAARVTDAPKKGGKKLTAETVSTESPIYVPGVTTILKMLDDDKSGRLQGWAVKVGAERLDELLVIREKGGPCVQFDSDCLPLDEVTKLRLLQEVKGAHRKRTSSAGTVGTLVHEWVEAHILAALKLGPAPKAPVNKAVKSAVAAFKQWEAANKVKYLYSERKIFSLSDWYAGTTDIVARVGKRTVVADIKTSNYLQNEFWYQTAAYQRALSEELGLAIDDRLVIRLDKELGTVEPHSAVEEGRVYEDDLSIFLALRMIYRKLKEG